MTRGEAALAALQERLAHAIAEDDPAAMLTADAYRDAQAVMTVGGPEDLTVARALGWFHWMRFRAMPSGEGRDDFDAALRRLVPVYVADPNAVPESVRDMLSENPAAIASVAIGLASTYERTGEQLVLEQAVTLFRAAVEAARADDPRLASWLSSLMSALQALFRRTGDIRLLDEVVQAARDGVAASAAASPDRVAMLHSLGNALHVRFAQTRERADLDAAIEACAELLATIPANNPARAVAQSNLGSALRARYRDGGDPADLEAAIRALRQAIASTPADHPDQAARLSDLANALQNADPEQIGVSELSIAESEAELRFYDRVWLSEAAMGRDQAPRPRREPTDQVPDSGRRTPDPNAAGIAAPPHSGGCGGVDEPDLSPARFLVAQMPTRVPLSAEVSLLVRVSATPAAVPAAESALLQGFAIGIKGAQVTVVVQAPHELAPLGALEHVISVPASGDSSPVRFAFQARGLGPQQVMITAWAGGTFLAELGLELSVEQAGPYVDGPTRRAPVSSFHAEPGEVTLQVRFDGQRYTFQLLSQPYLFEPVLAEALTAQPTEAVERTIATLRAIATGSGGYSGSNARTWLEQAGVGLWNDMVPELIKEQFWLLRRNIRAFSIAAADDVIPWELLYPLAADHDDGFLVEQFPVMRRVYGQQRFRSFTVGEPRYVAPSGSPPNAEGEIAAIRRILGEASTSAAAIDRLDVLVDLIESGDCGMLHFACHNTFAAAAGGSAIAMGGGSFVPMLLNRAIMRHTLAERHPLVFINACRTAGAIPEYTRMIGWAQAFMAAGAGAFAGTLWAVRSESAAVFAETFYAALTAGSPLGEACHQARAESGRDHDDPTWLAYSVYGDPAAVATTASQP